jgi:hypothetical protein
MPDTGAPWNIPYVDDADLVRDFPTADEAQALAIAAALDAAGGLVAVKHALFTGTQTNSTATGAYFDVTDLSITHTLSDASNTLIISAHFGVAGSTGQRGQVGLAVVDGATLIGVGAGGTSRTQVSAGGQVARNDGPDIVTMPSVTFVYAPGDTLAHTFKVRATNLVGTTQTIYINRTENDNNDASRPRAASALVIQEVKV